MVLNLTTLAEHRIQVDLIETYRIMNGIVEYGQDKFNVSISGSNIIRELRYDSNNLVKKKLKTSFISEQVKIFWNNLPVSAKTS